MTSTYEIGKLFTHLETWTRLVVYAMSSVCWLWVLPRAPPFLYALRLTFPIVANERKRRSIWNILL
jgi:hypothetical protein